MTAHAAVFGPPESPEFYAHIPGYTIGRCTGCSTAASGPADGVYEFMGRHLAIEHGHITPGHAEHCPPGTHDLDIVPFDDPSWMTCNAGQAVCRRCGVDLTEAFIADPDLDERDALYSDAGL